MATEESTIRRQIAERMAEAAMSLLDTLDLDQRQRAVLPLDPSSKSADTERRTWFYTPADHGGLPLSAMSPDQHRRTHRLLSTGLSRPGYVTAATIMGLENVLDHTEGWAASFGRERGRDPLLYWITLFGTPDETVWGWRFGGHHVSCITRSSTTRWRRRRPTFSAPTPQRHHCSARTSSDRSRRQRISVGNWFIC